MMRELKYVSWQREGFWLGYLEQYPDYWTQGETFEDLLEHLKDLQQDLTDDGFYPPAGFSIHSG